MKTYKHKGHVMCNWHIYWNQYYLETNENNEENGSHHCSMEDCSIWMMIIGDDDQQQLRHAVTGSSRSLRPVRRRVTTNVAAPHELPFGASNFSCRYM